MKSPLSRSSCRQPLPLLALGLALLISAGGLAAQQPVTVSGTVVDAGTGAPIAGARIDIPEIGRFTLADTAGRFEFMGVHPGSHRVRVGRIGYQPLIETWEIREVEEPRRIALTPDPVMLEGITVQADRLEQRRRATAMSVRAFDQDDLQRSAAFDARDFIFHSGGVFRTGCPGGIGIFGDDDCILWRGRVVRPVVYIDERPAIGGLDELASYPVRDLFALEVYDGGRHIRAYTTWFMQRLARTGRTLTPIDLWW